MKRKAHPQYATAVAICACGNTFSTRSTQPVLNTDICASCHPFYTGSARDTTTTGRVAMFNRKYARTGAGHAHA